jgi:antitoxin component of MazEF toxin-antitoxin module
MSMAVHVTKSGDALFIEIPRALAVEAGIAEGDELQLAIESAGRVVLQAASRSPLTLEDLLSRITPENCRGETGWGPPVGKEVW